MFSRTPRTDVAGARRLLDEGALLLDVREPHEWRAGHAPDAVHVPLDALASRADELPRGRRIVAMCRSGNRSGAATGMLRRLGYDVVNLAGGIQGWAAAGQPVVRDDGGAGRIA